MRSIVVSRFGISLIGATIALAGVAFGANSLTASHHTGITLDTPGVTPALYRNAQHQAAENVPIASVTDSSSYAAGYDPNTAYDPGTDGWTLGDPYAEPYTVDPNTAYDPGTDGWTLGDPFAGGSSSDTGS